MRKIISAFAILMVLVLVGCSAPETPTTPDTPAETPDATPSAEFEGKKVLYIDSYHEGYGWSDGITEGVTTTLKDTGAELKVHSLDTKRNPSVEFAAQAGNEARDLIESWKPDVVIACDDNAFKFIIQAHYKNADVPFVYCGINWDSSIYDTPYSNAVGMVEVALTPQLLDRVKKYANGDRIGYISGDTETERKTMGYYDNLFGLKFEKEYWVADTEEFKTAYLALQDEVDYILLENTAGIVGWEDSNNPEMKKFIMENTKIPSGTTYDFVAPYTLIALTKVAQEQGEWSAEAALEILGGKSPSEMSEVKNQRGDLFINMKLADELGVVFESEILKNSQVIE